MRDLRCVRGMEERREGEVEEVMGLKQFKLF